MPVVTVVGIIHSSLKDLKDCPLQENEGSPEARLEILPEFANAAKDIREGDALVLLTWLDRSDRSILVTHPRNDVNAPLTGIFSTRSPDRPNPVGLHNVRVSARLTDGSVLISGIEVLDQTPVIDIKPLI